MSKSIMVAQATITPGPPLPASHPSPSLLAKLYLNVYNLYESSRALAKSVGPTTGGAQKLLNSIKRDRPALTTRGSDSEASDGIAPDFRTYMTDGRAFSSSLGYKWLGVDAGENSSNTGTALGWLVLSRNGLLALQDRSKTVLPLKKGKVERAKRKDRITEELDDIDGFIKAYKRINDTVGTRPPIPSAEVLTLYTCRSCFSRSRRKPPSYLLCQAAVPCSPSRLSHSLRQPSDHGKAVLSQCFLTLRGTSVVWAWWMMETRIATGVRSISLNIRATTSERVVEKGARRPIHIFRLERDSAH